MMDWQEHITVDPEILRNYPALTREDIHTCLAYASAILKSEKVYILAA